MLDATEYVPGPGARASFAALPAPIRLVADLNAAPAPPADESARRRPGRRAGPGIGALLWLAAPPCPRSAVEPNGAYPWITSGRSVERYAPGPTTAGVVSTAVMVLRAARLVIAIAPRSLNSAEERGSEPELRKSTTANRLASATDFDKRAHAKTQRAGSPSARRARAERSVGARASVTAFESADFRYYALAQVRSLLCGAALRLPEPRTPPPRRSDAPTGRAATRPTARAG